MDFELIKTKKGQGYAESRQIFKELRSKYELSPSAQLPILKDLFELFTETHYSR